MHDGSHGEDCFGCKIKSIRIGPSAMPTRRNSAPPSPTPNSWEKGIVKDSRGLPVRRQDGKVIGVKEWENNRAKYDKALHRSRQGAN